MAWKSPITAAIACGSVTRFDDVYVDNVQQRVYHLESDPDSGKLRLVDSVDETRLTLEDGNTRSRVHEYGGGSAGVHDNQAIFTDMSNKVYLRKKEGGNWGDAVEVSPDNSALRYADFQFHPQSTNLIAAVQEDHTIDEPSKVVNRLVLIDTDSKSVSKLASGADFYSCPRFNEAGDQLTFVSWNLPSMQWEKSELHLAEFNSKTKSVTNTRKIAGGEHSVDQPEFVPGTSDLAFLSDKSGYNRPYLYSKGETTLIWDEETGRDIGSPAWVFGGSAYTVLDSDTALLQIKSDKLALVSLREKTKVEKIDVPTSTFDHIKRISDNEFACVISSATAFAQVARVKLDRKSSPANLNIVALKEQAQLPLDQGYLTQPRVIEFESQPDPGQHDKQHAYAVYYPPKNKDHDSSDKAAPTIIECHGGPTAQASQSFSLSIQYFTSRGFAVASVDYGGSSGYGTHFRDRLVGNWGIVDVNDAVACAEYLIKSGLADSKKIAIRGGSAGGYTTLAALCDSKVFTAGCSLYGVSDLAALAGDTHKFESQYLYNLVGGTLEEVPEIYRDRSPINKAEQITSDLLLLQGSDDKVVLPNQSQMIADKVRANGGAVEYTLFEGEGHGFRQKKNVIASLELQLAFYERAFKL